MAYVKQTWQTGDTVTADKLNHMEDGIAEGGGGAYVIGATIGEVSGTPALIMDKTFHEIQTVFAAGQVVFLQRAEIEEGVEAYTRYYVSDVVADSDGLGISMAGSGMGTFYADTENDYPYLVMQN